MREIECLRKAQVNAEERPEATSCNAMQLIATSVQDFPQPAYLMAGDSRGLPARKSRMRKLEPAKLQNTVRTPVPARRIGFDRHKFAPCSRALERQPWAI